MIKLASGIILAFVLFLTAAPAKAQMGNSGSIEGVVKDQSGAVIVGAKAEISNPVTGFRRETTSGKDGSFRFTNIPFNPYHLTVTAAGFASYSQDVDVRSTVPTNVQIGLALGTAETSINVQAKGEDLVEKDSTFHTDIDQAFNDRPTTESATSSMSNMVTLLAPGFAADSNGLAHGLGDHAQVSFAVDNQPISDQQSKIFSNQIPTDSIQ